MYPWFHSQSIMNVHAALTCSKYHTCFCNLTKALTHTHTRTTLTTFTKHTHMHHPHNLYQTHTHTQWAVFSCGHPLCVECTSTLTKHQQRYCSEPSVTIKCPLCREPSISTEINFVRVGVASEESQDIPVQGCHSTKIAAVVRTLLYLQQTEPGAKSLVFSAVSFMLTTALCNCTL